MRKIFFSKYSGNGNHFLILDNPGCPPSPQEIAKMCNLQFGVGGDGVLLLTPEENHDRRMRIFNADGGEAEMCGNGLRCVAAYLHDQDPQKKNRYTIRMMNSSYPVEKRDGGFAIEMTEIKEKNLYDLSAFSGFRNSFFVNTGVPHLIFEATDVRSMDLKTVAPFYRYHKLFPKGTNVSFLEVSPGNQTAYVRTYERGVEDETFSCGTGLTAAALALQHWHNWSHRITLRTLGGTQTVTIGEKIHYSGEVTFCFRGEYVL